MLKVSPAYLLKQMNHCTSCTLPEPLVPICFITITSVNFLRLGEPKGVQRPVGGHLVALMFTMKTLYGMGPNDVWWATSDFGWVVGHSYMCYGPLLYGITSIIYEGKPTTTPDPSSYYRFCTHQLKLLVNLLIKSLIAGLSVIIR